MSSPIEDSLRQIISEIVEQHKKLPELVYQNRFDDVQPLGNTKTHDLDLAYPSRGEDDPMLPKLPNRFSIAEEQKKAATLEQAEIFHLLKEYLPNYVFVKDPYAGEAKPGRTVPTLIEKEVTRAKANAELNVYLAHVAPLQGKLDFLGKYKNIREKAHGSNAAYVKSMKTFARKHHEVDNQGNAIVKKEKQAEFNSLQQAGKQVGNSFYKSRTDHLAPIRNVMAHDFYELKQYLIETDEILRRLDVIASKDEQKGKMMAVSSDKDKDATAKIIWTGVGSSRPEFSQVGSSMRIGGMDGAADTEDPVGRGMGEDQQPGDGHK